MPLVYFIVTTKKTSTRESRSSCSPPSLISQRTTWYYTICFSQSYIFADPCGRNLNRFHSERQYTSLDNAVIEVVISCWVNSIYSVEVQDYFTDLYYQTLRPRSRDRTGMRRVYDRLINTPRSFAKFFDSYVVVLLDHNILDRKLPKVLDLLRSMLECCPASLVENLDGDDVLMAVTTACRRSICAADSGSVNGIVVRGAMVMRYAASAFCLLCGK